MDNWLKKSTETLAGVMAGYEENPVDLLDIGDSDSEWTYLLNAQQSYRRTLSDVGRIVSKRVASGEKVKILEIGAYLGAVSLSLSRIGCEVTALDLPEFMENERLQEKYRQGSVQTVSANLRDYSLPFADGSFDLVIMCETLEHLNFNPLPVFAEINRVLVRDGWIYLALPNLSSLVNRLKLLCGRSIHNPISDYIAQLSKESNMIVGIHWREYTWSELVALLHCTGFESEHHEYLNIPGSHMIARALYLLFPYLRPAQSVAAQKIESIRTDFHFTQATKMKSGIRSI